jgi:hypothetical protein
MMKKNYRNSLLKKCLLIKLKNEWKEKKLLHDKKMKILLSLLLEFKDE